MHMDPELISEVRGQSRIGGVKAAFTGVQEERGGPSGDSITDFSRLWLL